LPLKPNLHTLALAGSRDQSYNEEFNGYLIWPMNPRLFCSQNVQDARSEEEKDRFKRNVAGLYQTDGVGEYCRALMRDQGLWAKVAGFKKSTVRSFINGTVDLPLCDQVCFIHEWLQTHKAEALSEGSKGKWWVDPQSGITGVADAAHPHSLGTPALQPRLVDPQNVALLSVVRNALEEHLLRHLEVVGETLGSPLNDTQNRLNTSCSWHRGKNNKWCRVDSLMSDWQQVGVGWPGDWQQVGGSWQRRRLTINGLAGRGVGGELIHLRSRSSCTKGSS